MSKCRTCEGRGCRKSPKKCYICPVINSKVHFFRGCDRHCTCGELDCTVEQQTWRYGPGHHHKHKKPIEQQDEPEEE